MKTWFVCKAKFQKENEQGFVRNVTESYLVDAFSYTEAETRFYEILEEQISGDFLISQISKSNITELFISEDCDLWFKCKVVYHVSDEDSEKAKKIINFMMISAQNVKDAYEKLQANLSNMLVSYQITSIAESAIVEVFPFQSPENQEERIPDNLKSLNDLED